MVILAFNSMFVVYYHDLEISEIEELFVVGRIILKITWVLPDLCTHLWTMAGAGGVRTIPKLVDLCIQTAIDNVRYMGDVGETDILLLKEILPHCTADLLMHIENSTKVRVLYIFREAVCGMRFGDNYILTHASSLLCRVETLARSQITCGKVFIDKNLGKKTWILSLGGWRSRMLFLSGNCCMRLWLLFCNAHSHATFLSLHWKLSLVYSSLNIMLNVYQLFSW